MNGFKLNRTPIQCEIDKIFLMPYLEQSAVLKTLCVLSDLQVKLSASNYNMCEMLGNQTNAFFQHMRVCVLMSTNAC